MKPQQPVVNVNITPEMVGQENQLVCKLCGGDIWLANIAGKVALVPNPMIGEPPIQANLLQNLCLTCLTGGVITLLSPETSQTRKDAKPGN